MQYDTAIKPIVKVHFIHQNILIGDKSKMSENANDMLLFGKTGIGQTKLYIHILSYITM